MKLSLKLNLVKQYFSYFTCPLTFLKLYRMLSNVKIGSIFYYKTCIPFHPFHVSICSYACFSYVFCFTHPCIQRRQVYKFKPPPPPSDILTIPLRFSPTGFALSLYFNNRLGSQKLREGCDVLQSPSRFQDQVILKWTYTKMSVLQRSEVLASCSTSPLTDGLNEFPRDATRAMRKWRRWFASQAL